jgi:hypothetical protein
MIHSMHPATLLGLATLALAAPQCPPTLCDEVRVPTDWYHKGQAKKLQDWLEVNTIRPKCLELKDANRLAVGDVVLDDVKILVFDYSDNVGSGRRFRASGTATCVFQYLKV